MSTDIQVKKVEKSTLGYVGFWGKKFTALEGVANKDYIYKIYKTTKEWVDEFLAQQSTGIPDLETWIRTIIDVSDINK